MEQTRTIAAMKSHIDKLQTKLDSLQQNGNENCGKSSPDNMQASNGSNHKSESKTGGLRKSHKKKKKSESKSESKCSDIRRKKGSSKSEKGETSESGEDIFVYIENENDPLKEIAHESKIETTETEVTTKEERSRLAPSQKDDLDLEIRLDSGLASDIIDESLSDDLYNADTHSPVKSNSQSSDNNLKDCEAPPEISVHNADDFKPKNRLSQSEEAAQVSNTNDSASPINSQEQGLSNGLTENGCEDTLLGMQSDADDKGTSFVVTYTGKEDSEQVDLLDGTGMGDNIDTIENLTSDERFELEEANAELKERVAELEEQLWLAAEERRNMQSVLELQKERALKNLAFKFEDINRKTLREFKGIFEYRLQELNEEKMKLQEKLDSHKCMIDNGEHSCEGCKVLKEKLDESEKELMKLLKDNDVLKRRCRKLSGDLGKVKKVIGSLAASDDVTCIDASCQTDASDEDSREIGIQCERNIDASLNDLHDEVKEIATKISVISNQLLKEQSKWSHDEEFFTEKDAIRSVSSNNESGIESLQLSQEKSRSDHDESDLGDCSTVSNSDNSERSEKIANPSFTDFFGEDAKQFAGQVDDVDSSLFGNNVAPLSTYDIEAHLLKIHAKYLKISEELENFATGKLKRNVETETGNGKTDINFTKLDPEIKKLVDDVNRKYDEYFKTKLVL